MCPVYMGPMLPGIEMPPAGNPFAYLRKHFADAETTLRDLQQVHDQSLRERELLRAKLAILPFRLAAADESLRVSPGQPLNHGEAERWSRPFCFSPATHDACGTLTIR